MNGNWLEAAYNGVLSPTIMLRLLQAPLLLGEDNSFSGSMDFGFVAPEFCSLLKLASQKPSCRGWMEAHRILLQLVVCHSPGTQPRAQPPSAFFFFFLHEWRVSYWDYVNGFAEWIIQSSKENDESLPSLQTAIQPPNRSAGASMDARQSSQIDCAQSEESIYHNYLQVASWRQQSHPAVLYIPHFQTMLKSKPYPDIWGATSFF